MLQRWSGLGGNRNFPVTFAYLIYWWVSVVVGCRYYWQLTTRQPAGRSTRRWRWLWRRWSHRSQRPCHRSPDDVIQVDTCWPLSSQTRSVDYNWKQFIIRWFCPYDLKYNILGSLQVIGNVCTVLCQCEFLPRDAMHSADYAVTRYLSVCRSVCLSVTSRFVSKRLNISSDFFHRRVATPFCFFHSQTIWHYSNGDTLTEASNAGGEKSRFSTNISLYLAISRFFSEMIQDRTIVPMECE